MAAGKAFGATIAFLAIAIAAIGTGPARAGAVVADPAAILAMHNKARAALGIPPLRWSKALAQGASNWARTIAALDELKHSGTPGIGENLAMTWAPRPSLDRMIGTWIAEKAYFRRGVFPDIATNGSWAAAGHYSQMIWRTTTEVGCGDAYNGRTNFLVCRYAPAGNYVGQTPY